MAREEMIAEMRQGDVGVYLVYMSAEGGLDATLISKDGYAYLGWIEDWPWYKMSVQGKVEAEHFCERIRSGTLTFSEIYDFSFWPLASLLDNCLHDAAHASSEAISNMLLGLCDVLAKADEVFYVHRSDANNQLSFFATYQEVKAAVLDEYPITPWDEAPDGEIELCYRDWSKEQDIPFTEFNDER